LIRCGFGGRLGRQREADGTASNRVDFLLQAKNRMTQSARPPLTIPLVQIAGLIAAIAIFLLAADREGHQRAIERAVCAEVVMNQAIRARRLAEMDSGSVGGGRVFRLRPRVSETWKICLLEQTHQPGEPVEAVRLYGIREYLSCVLLYADAHKGGSSCLIVSPQPNPGAEEPEIIQINER
jgi:hypothetical protein